MIPKPQLQLFLWVGFSFMEMWVPTFLWSLDRVSYELPKFLGPSWYDEWNVIPTSIYLLAWHDGMKGGNGMKKYKGNAKKISFHFYLHSIPSYQEGP